MGDVKIKISPVLKSLKAKFQNSCLLGESFCIDESLTLWRGRLGFLLDILYKP
jgi:hypothetical protein